jgi:branched-chain amino acid transport system substrate-binding protein
MLRSIIFWSLLGTLLIVCAAWFGTLVYNAQQDISLRSRIAEIRAERQQEASGPICIGIAETRPLTLNRDFVDGVNLAIRRINDAGGLLGRPLKCIYRDDRMNRDEAVRVAQAFASDLDIVAVIGHNASDQAGAAAILYEFNGMVFLTPGATDPRLTESGRDLLFCTTPNDQAVGRRLAAFADRQGYRRILVYYTSDDFGRSLANACEIEAGRYGIDVIGRRKLTFNAPERQIRRDLEYWQQFHKHADAIVLAMPYEDGRRTVSIARSIGLAMPLMASEALDHPGLFEGNQPIHDLFVATDFAALPEPENETFREAFTAACGREATNNAAEGYDAVMFLAEAIRRCGSTVPAEIALALHSPEGFVGTTGQVSFAASGTIIAPTFLKEATGREFRVIPAEQSDDGNALHDDRRDSHHPRTLAETAPEQPGGFSNAR